MTIFLVQDPPTGKLQKANMMVLSKEITDKDRSLKTQLLINILLIATEESNYHYCYCSQKNNSPKCALCRLCSFLYIRTDRRGFIEGLPPKKFLAKIL